MNNNATTPQNATTSSIQVFHCHSKVYGEWVYYAEEVAGVSILVLNEHYASTNYHRVTLRATPAQMLELLQEHQHLMKTHNITNKP